MPLRVFIGFHEVAGFYSGLRIGLEKCGCQVSFVEAEANPFGYDSRGNNTLLEKRVHETFFSEPGSQWKKILTLWKVIRSHDVFVFSHGRSFPGEKPHWALPWLKRFGKKIVFILTGSEGRPPYVGRNGFSKRDGAPVLAHELLAYTKEIAKNICLMEQYANIIVTHSLTAQLHKRPFVSLLRLGNPASFAVLEKAERAGLNRTESNSIRILHAPSWPELKGSNRIRAAVDTLKSEGFDIKYTELTGVPNAKILEALSSTDLLIDELYSDIPMASLAAEAASLGVPALVGGYGWDNLRHSSDSEVMPPAFLCEPENVTSKLREILSEGKESIAAKSKEAQSFVLEQWQPKAVAERFLQCLESSPPAEWIVDPTDCDYAWGCGVPKAAISEMLGTILSIKGKSCLSIDDKPALQAQYQQLLSDMSDSKDTSPELTEMIERNKALQLKLKAVTEKLANFKAMTQRRDEKIAKLEKRVK